MNYCGGESCKTNPQINMSWNNQDVNVSLKEEMWKLKSSNSLARLCHDVLSWLFLSLLLPHDHSGAGFSGVGKVPQWEAPFRFVALLPRGTWLAGLKDVGMGPETLLVVFSQLCLTVRYNPGKFPFYDPNYSSFKICQKPNLTALKKNKSVWLISLS